MAFLTTIIIIFIVVAIIYAIYSISSNSDKTSPYVIKGRYVIYLKTGNRFEGEVDYSNPNDYIRYEENTGKPYVIRKKLGMFAFMDKGPEKLYLKNFKQIDYDGYNVIYNNIDMFNEWLSRDLINKEKELIDVKNRLAEKISENAQLQTKLEEELKVRVKQYGDFSKSLPYFPPTRKR